MKQENAELIASIVWGDHNRPTVSWLGRQFEKADNLLTAGSNAAGLRYTSRVMEKELKRAGFSDDAVKAIRDCLLSQAGRVYKTIADKPVAFTDMHGNPVKRLPTITARSFFGYEDSRLAHKHDFRSESYRKTYFEALRHNFVSALAGQDIAVPEELQKTAIPAAISLRQKFYTAAACLAPMAVGCGAAAGMLSSPILKDIPPGEAGLAMVVFMGLFPAIVASTAGMICTFRGGLADAVSTARAVPPTPRRLPNHFQREVNYY